MDFTNLKETIGNYLIKGVAAALAGESLHELAGGGHIFGKVIFFGFAQSMPAVEFLNRQLVSDEMYRTWGGEIGSALLDHLLETGGLLLLLSLLLLLAHVLLKREAMKSRRDNLYKYGLVGSFYCRYYFLITLLLQIFFLASLFAATTAFPILAYFLLIALPAVIYLLYNSRDVLKGDFAEQFMYVTTLVILAFAIVALPYNYGRWVFDIKLFSARLSEGEPGSAFGSDLFRCSENALGKTQLLCEVGREEGRLIVRFRDPSERPLEVGAPEPMKILLAELSDGESQPGLFSPSRSKELASVESPKGNPDETVEQAADAMQEMIQ